MRMRFWQCGSIALLLMVGCCPTITQRTITRERIDTLRVAGDTVLFEAPGRIEWDTLYAIKPDNGNTDGSTTLTMTKPFAATLDTTVERIGMILQYRYPSNRWHVMIVQRDTVVSYKVRDSLIERSVIQTVPVTPAWVYVVFSVFGAGAVGFLVKKVI